MRSPYSNLVVVIGTLAVAAHPVGAQDYHNDIRPILEQSCISCHADGALSFSLTDDAEALRRRRSVASAILKRRMPPWLAEEGHQNYVDDPSLTPEQIDLVARWVEGGYAEGTPTSTPMRVAEAAPFRADLTLDVLGGESYLPNQDMDDDYRCFVVEWPQDQEGYIKGFRAVPGNTGVAHHVVVHAVEPGLGDRFQELDAEEEGLGYQCFGGALPDRFNSEAIRTAYDERYPRGVRELSRGSFWLSHWAPGMDGYAFPAGTGIRMKPGSALVVQMHYYSRHAPGESDANTTLDFQLADDVERPAIHFPMTENDWLAGKRNGSMVVPPGEQASVQTSQRLGDLVGYMARRAGVAEERVEALEVHSANLHMHSYGHSGRITLTDTHGREETLLSVPSWDLGWQRDFTFLEPKVFEAGAMGDAHLTVHCTFENLTDVTVYGGYGSDEEMCFNFSYIAVQLSDKNAASGGR